MTGLIGVIAQETARFSMFASSLAEMDLPEGWETKFRFGWDLADGQNALIQEALERGKEWVWLMGDDHVWSPGLLRKLLAHDLDLVIPLCLMRNPPYRPVNWLATDDPDQVRRLNLDDYPDGGLVEIAASGAAGLLIRANVFDKIPEPWFETGTGITNRVGEDVNFCKKAREAGFRIYCDLDSVLGHCSTTVVWPVREYDGWTYAFSMMGGFQITMPPKTGWILADEAA